jgi:2-polyprenyl-3-methyl-5-hydroxy-6-metoxy-1,4-benzoquinol methylase
MQSLQACQEAIDRLVATEKLATSGGNAEGPYKAMHDFRHRKTVEICKQWVPSPQAKVLDVGRSAMTDLLATQYRDISTLGFPIFLGPNETDPRPQVPHIEFDLTRCADTQAWPARNSEFDLIVYCETIEHLPIAPEFSLIFLCYLLKQGGMLLVTTPNAVRLGNRIRMALGQNPFERIRYFDQNPGHFREYTCDELRAMAEPSGLNCIEARTLNMYPRPWKRWLASIGPLQGFADNLLAVYEKP